MAPEAVDVAARPQAVEVASAPARGSCRPASPMPIRAVSPALPLAERDEGPFVVSRPGSVLADGLGQPPIDDQRLAVLAEHDVARLEVAVQDPAAVGIGDRIADVGEPAQQVAEVERAARRAQARAVTTMEALDGVLEASPRMNRIA